MAPGSGGGLHELVKATGESASFYVREGDIRSCVARVEGPQSVRHNVRIGERLPLNRGAPGRVILAFSGAPGEPYESIRERGFTFQWASASRKYPAWPHRCSR